MKYVVVIYINADDVISTVESCMSYLKFDTVETNSCYRVFSGTYKEGIDSFVQKINTHLSDVDFDVEDSIFFMYRRFTVNRRQDMGMIAIKRKGNKELRKPYK